MANTLDGRASAYTAAFPHYDENRIVHLAYGQRIAAHIRAAGATSALSLGIGHREVAQPLLDCLAAGALARYTIVDASHDMVEEFVRCTAPLPPGLELIEDWFESFDTQDRFDVIEAGFVLEHVEDPGVVLRRMHRFIRPGGCMFVAVPNACSLHRVIGSRAGMLADLYALSEADRRLGHRRYFDLPRLRELVDSCGWRVMCARGLLLKPFTTSQMAKLALPPQVWQALQSVAADYPEIANAFELVVTPAT